MGSETDFLSQFIDALAAAGCPPEKASDIKADDKWHRYKVAGDREPNARYQLKIENDFAVGRFIYFKDGVSHSWHSASEKKLSKEERAAREKAIEKARIAREKEQAKEFAQAAAECREIWAAAKEKTHPYLKKKGVSAEGSRVADLTGADGRVQKNVLLIPIYKDNRLSSLQRIWPNGFKAFWEGGDVAGGYAALAEAGDDKSTIVICEGWATGKSIREAVGWPVIVAFNAGNLGPVAALMRGKYPDSRIIIASDHDQWTFNVRHRPQEIKKPSEIPGDDPRWQEWREKGWLWNPGLEKAQQCAVKIGAHVIFPDIPGDDKDKRTDFNDQHLTDGLEAVKNRILVAAPAKTQPDGPDPYEVSQYGVGPSFEEGPPDYFDNVPAVYEDESFQSLYGVQAAKNPDWRTELYCKDDGTPKGNSLNNARLFIENHPDYAGLFCYDEFAHEKVVAHCPPWENDKHFKPRTLRDEDVTNLAMHIEKKGISLSIQNLRKVLDAVIMAETKNPAKEYFLNLKWDGVPRLNTWLREYAGCKNDDPEYLAAVGRKWLTAAVTRVMEPGCKFDHILILEGDQNLGKSMMLRELATIHGRAYFDDTIKARDLPLEKTVPKLQGVLIIELAEMTGFKKMGPDEAKQVISTQHDRIVRKYQNEPTKLPRQFVFAGTLNPLDGYLDDPTGNRRYWPVTCSKIDIKALKRDKEQLWAEATQLWRDGEKLYLEDALYRKAEEAQQRRAMIHPWQADIEKAVRFQDAIPTEDIWSALLISDRSKRTRAASDDIGKIMTGLGFEYARKRVNGDRQWAWYRKEKAEEPDFIESKEEDIPW